MLNLIVLSVVGCALDGFHLFFSDVFTFCLFSHFDPDLSTMT